MDEHETLMILPRPSACKAGLRPAVGGLVVFLALAIFPLAASTQDARPIDLTPSCPSCGLFLDEVLTLSSEREEIGALENAWTMSTDARGRYWVTYAGMSLPQVFTPDGALVGDVGRRGQGPREFQSVLAAVPVGDSMALFDQANGRMTMVGPDLTPTRTVPVAGQVLRGAPLEWPRVVVNGRMVDAGATGYPFHVLDVETGEVKASFGPRFDHEPPGRARRLLLGLVTVDSEGRIWTAMPAEFRLQRWSPVGELLETLEATPSWFEGAFPPGWGSPSTPPSPRLAMLAASDEGIWLGVRLPAERWREAWLGASGGVTPHDSPADGVPAQGGGPDPDLLYQGRMMLLDPDAGRVVNTWDVEPSGLSGGWIPGEVQSHQRVGAGGVFPSRTVHHLRVTGLP